MASHSCLLLMKLQMFQLLGRQGRREKGRELKVRSECRERPREPGKENEVWKLGGGWMEVVESLGAGSCRGRG